MGPLLEPVQAAVGLQEGLLDHVFGVVLVSCHTIGQAKDVAAVALHETAERVGVPGPGLRHGLGVVVASGHPLH